MPMTDGTTFLRQLRRTIAAHCPSQLADSELLGQFLRERDEASFTALVRRHGSMVLGVACNVLHDQHDAEDVFQATFLLLARKAGTINNHQSLSSWLHGVAHRLALKMLAQKGRRKTHEKSAGLSQSAKPGDDLTMRDVRAILHEELSCLPEKYRAPLLLCYWEGKTRDEAAECLGMTANVLKKRLEQARGILGKRLTRRGLAPTVALFTWWISESGASAAVSRLLIQNTGQAAVAFAASQPAAAGASTTAITLAQGAIRTMFLTKCFTILLTLLAVIGVGAALSFAGYQALQSPVNSAIPQIQAKPEAVVPPVAKADVDRIGGIVVDSDGKPVAGAEVEFNHGMANVRAVSQSDGKFQLAVADAPKYGFSLLARSQDGERLAYLYVADPESKADWKSLRLVLKPPHLLPTTVMDGKGQPVAGSRVGAISEHVRVVAESRTDDQGKAVLRMPADSVVESVFAWKRGAGFDYRSLGPAKGNADRTQEPLPAKISLKLEGARTLRVTVVDGDGRPLPKLRLYPWFLIKPGETNDINLSGAITDLGATTDENGVAAWDWLPTWQQSALTINPIAKEHARRRLSWDPKGGTNATLVLDRLEPLRGRVTHADGSPAAGINIRIRGAGYDHENFSGETKTNADGKYELGVAPYQLYLLVVDDKTWAAEAQTGFAVMPKIAVPDKDFVLRVATVIQGKITVGTGMAEKPHAGQRIGLRQYGTDNLVLPNALPNPQKSRLAVQTVAYNDAVTDAEGRFEFRAGPGKYVLFGPSQIKPVNITITDQKRLEFNLNAPRVESGPLTGLVVSGTPPTPVAGAIIQGIYRGYVSVGDLAAKTNADGRFAAQRQLHGMVLRAWHPDGKLTGVVEIGPDDTTVTIPLTKMATAQGRLIDSETGLPLADQKIQYSVHVLLGEMQKSWRPAFGGNAVTDSAGRFDLKGLVARQKYYVDIVLGKDDGWRTATTFVPAAGESVQLGNVKVTPERRPKTPAENRNAAFDVKGTPIERFEAARRDAALSRQHVLVIFASPKDAVTEKLFNILRDREDLGNRLDNYRTIWIATDNSRLPAAQALADKVVVKEVRPKLGEAPALMLVVADANGKMLATLSEERSGKDSKLNSFPVRRLLDDDPPERLNAEKLLADALAQAKKENKRVIVQETATWCGPCWRLSRFLDQQRAVWEKDYLWVKMDHRWANCEKVMEPLRNKAEGGVPWTAILDADGKVLATSNGKDGANIGFPSDAAGIAHFTTMIRTTAIRLTPKEIVDLAEALKVANQP